MEFLEQLCTYSLGQGTALADGNPVTLLNTESGRDVSSKVLVSLLVTVVLGDVVEVFTADDDGTVHLGGDNTAGQDTATDGDHTSEGALLVCLISAIYPSSRWRFMNRFRSSEMKITENQEGKIGFPTATENSPPLSTISVPQMQSWTIMIPRSLSSPNPGKSSFFPNVKFEVSGKISP